MRQLATLSNAGAARTLADYLLSLKIETRLLPEAGGWGVWVCDEDRLTQARQELAEFERNPRDSRFAAAAERAEVQREPRQEDHAPTRRPTSPHRPADIGARHPITSLLLTASVVVTFATDMGSTRSVWTNRLTIAPLVGRGNTLPDMLQQGQVWRLVTPIFLHLHPLHLLFNMIIFYQLGRIIEENRGSGRYLCLILACAIPSNLVQYYLGHATWEGSWPIPHPAPYFGGMSGVVYGLFGYLWMKAVFEPELGMTLPMSAVMLLMLNFFLCFSKEFQDLVGLVANMAHGGGLLSGIAIGIAPSLGQFLRGVRSPEG
jgi:GlpG protein